MRVKVERHKHHQNSFTMNIKCKGNYNSNKSLFKHCESTLEICEQDIKSLTRITQHMTEDGAHFAKGDVSFYIVCPVCHQETEIPSAMIPKKVKTRILQRN